MTALTVIPVSRTTPADNVAGLQAVSAADTFPADGQTYIRIKNGNAAGCVVTVTPPANGGPLGQTVAPLVLGSVPATTGDREFGPFPQNPFGDSNGNINLTYSVTSSVQIMVKKYNG